MPICKNKQNQTTDIPLFWTAFVVPNGPVFVFANPTHGSTGARGGFYSHGPGMTRQRSRCLPQRHFLLNLATGFRDSVWCWSRNWTAWKLILGMLIKRSQKESLPELADILGQPQEDLAVSFNEMCQYCSSQARFPALFAVTWREASEKDVETETNDASLFLTGIKCGSNRKVMKMIWTVHYSGVIKLNHFGGSNNAGGISFFLVDCRLGRKCLSPQLLLYSLSQLDLTDKLRFF